MIKRLWLFSLILLYCATAKAQFTSVTATVTDLDSQTWNNGSWSVSLYNQYPQSPANINGTPLTPSQLNQSGAINGSGALSLTLADNSIVAPSGTYWVFIICPNASAQCAVVSTPVSGASQSISSILSANLKGPRFSANSQSGGAWGYLDSEIYPKPNPGGQYYNVSTGCQKVWSGSAWSCLGAGVGFALQVNGVAVTSPVNFANSASVSFTNPSGSLINAISTVAIGCNPSGSSGNILLDNGSHGCTDAPINYNSGTGAYTATIAGAATVSAASYSSTVTGIFSVTAGGLIQASNAGISFTDNSSANISIHEQGTSPINITADLGAVNLTGTSVNANGSAVCTVNGTNCPGLTGFTLSSNLAGSTRFFAANYQNTSAQFLDVYATEFQNSGVGSGSLLTGYIGPNTGSMTGVAKTGVTNSGGRTGVYLHVPPSWYYSVNYAFNGGTPTVTLDTWYEGQ